MKKILMVILTLIMFFSCGSKKSINQLQYEEYRKKILPSLEKNIPISEEKRNEVLKIFTIEYKDKRIDDFMMNTRLINSEDIKAVITIKLIANYKTDLVEVQRGFKDKRFDEQKYIDIINQLDESLISYLMFYGIDKVPKNTLYNLENKDMEISELLEQIKKDFKIQ